MELVSGQFFDFAQARESLRVAKEHNYPRPWSADKVLQQYYFCNIYREDDRTTRWFREHIRSPLSKDIKVFMATVVFRWFNRIETGEWIKDILLEDPSNIEGIEKVLRPKQTAHEQLFTGAYIIKSPNGKDKLSGLLHCMKIVDASVRVILNSRYVGQERQFTCMQALHKGLMEMPYLGPFMAYEIVTDLRHTYVLDRAIDIRSWASAGPGAARGLSWLRADRKVLPYGSAVGQEEMLEHMRNLLKESERYAWKRAWEMREVEHALCEFDKYKRGHAGERLKRRYGQ